MSSRQHNWATVLLLAAAIILSGTSLATTNYLITSGNVSIGSDSELFIDVSNWRLGIGTQRPSERLHIAGGGMVQEQAALEVVGWVNGTGLSPNSEGHGIYVTGKYAYVTSPDDGKLSIIDVSNPRSPQVIGFLEDGSKMANAWGVFTIGKYAYVSSEGKFAVIDVSDPTFPFSATALDVTGLARGRQVYISGTRAYVAVENGVAVVDLSNATNPILISSKVSLGAFEATDVVAIGRYAYAVSEGNNAFVIFDMADPGNPMEIGDIISEDETIGVSSLAISGRYAYLTASGINNITVIDISNVTNPQIVATVANPTGEPPEDIEIAGKYAYVSYGGKGISVFDISDPTSPQAMPFTGNITTKNIRRIFLSGRYIYASQDENTTAVISISGIEGPAASIGSVQAGEASVDMDAAISGDLSAGSGIHAGPGGIAVAGSIGSSSLGSCGFLRIENSSLNCAKGARFLARRTATQQIPASTWTTVNFTDDSTNESFDPYGVYNNGTYYFTPPERGIYHLGSNVCFSNITGSEKDLDISVNGTIVASGHLRTNSESCAVVSTILDINSNVSVQILVFSGSADNVTVHQSPATFWGYRIR